MKKLSIMLTTAAALLFVGSLGWQAQAQTLQQGASKILGVAATMKPTKLAACGGWGPYCGPGYVRQCGPFRCWCAPC
jgi:hypothetical protein